MSKQTKEDILATIGYPALKFLVGPVMRAIWIDEITGTENLPQTGPCIVAFNHESYFDFLLFTVAIKRKIHYLAAEKLFDHIIWKWIMRFVGSIKVDRYAKVNKRAYKEIKHCFQRGRLLGIFPEGARSPDGKLMRGKTGVAYLALKSGLPVLPVGFIGTYEILPRNKKLPRLRKAQIHIGKPITCDHLTNIPISAENLRKVTDEIMGQIALLTGEKYPEHP